MKSGNSDKASANTLLPGEVHLYMGPSLIRKRRDELLQEIAITYMGSSSVRTHLSYSPQGKPFFKNAELHLSISHTRNRLLIAFAKFAVGVDMESVDRPLSFEAIAQRYFDPSENWYLKNSSEAFRREMFFRIWVRKEAAVKMTGEGLAHGLRKVKIDPTREGWSISREKQDFFVKEVTPWPGVVGAIVAQRQFFVTAYREL